jgi:hypothetical protein
MTGGAKSVNGSDQRRVGIRAVMFSNVMATESTMER